MPVLLGMCMIILGLQYKAVMLKMKLHCSATAHL